MAPKVMVPQQPRGNAVAAGKQKAAIADGKNRRALGDIGNVVDARCAAEGKPQLPQVSRPITRSFGAQLLAKAQAAAANKKPLPAVPPVAQEGKAVRKKVTAKVKVEEVIEKSPRAKKESKGNPETKNSSREASSKKKVTLTSVLTSRSKYACGLSGKPKESDHDIDSADAEDQLAVAEYVEDIYKFYKLAEVSIQIHDYMDSQYEINSKMRAILVDWLIEVHSRFELMPETLYLAVHIVDRYLSTRSCCRRDLQLAGMTAMLIACKYEEIWAPEVNDFVCISDRAYNREQILVMEKSILNHLEWSLTVPTAYVFLLRFLKAAASDKEMENLVFFFAEMSLVEYCMIAYCPSILAASAVYAARCTLHRTPLWTETLKRHTSYPEQQLRECASRMVHFHATAADSKLKVVFSKYSSPQLGSVALLPPATNLLLSDSRRDTAS
ncbi:G2/mitotic-specific cyclin S13-7-like isoform X1 [Nymphaea colorata]|nr:G2/mitotic-specific cyclin S13-7-like isoform X1 [Nymphaea colorata]